MKSCGQGLLLILLVTAAAGCSSGEERTAEDRLPRIGFSLDSLVVERWKRDVEAFTRAAADLGAEVRLEVADQDLEVQLGQVRKLVSQGIDVLVVVPNDALGLSPVLREVRARGIPVVSYDRLAREAEVDLYISFDNREVGRKMAESLIKAVPAGNYLVINGARSDDNALQLNKGVYAALTPLMQSGRIRLVKEIWPLSWDSEEVRIQMEFFLSQSTEVDAVIAGNDMLAEAAIAVLTENRLASRVRVAGQDAELAACQRIAEGVQYSTIYKPVEELALKAAAFSVMLARGEPLGVHTTIFDGRKEVPYINLEPRLVTRELLEATVIQDGYHRAEDVYRNVRR